MHTLVLLNVVMIYLAIFVEIGIVNYAMRSDMSSDKYSDRILQFLTKHCTAFLDAYASQVTALSLRQSRLASQISRVSQIYQRTPKQTQERPNTP